MTGRGPLSCVLVTVGLLLAGCAFAPADPPVTTSVLDELPADVPHRAASGTTLIVFPPQARPALDGPQMAYTLQAHQLAYFTRNEWAESPAFMLQPLLVRTLERTGAFAAVVSPPHRSLGALGLRTEIVELVQDFSRDAPVLRLVLRARLSDEGGNRVLSTREFTVEAPMAARSPSAGVVAANSALAQALEQLAAWVLSTPR